jgi:glycosyltransferase involved in cell wall biosynthesis
MLKAFVSGFPRLSPRAAIPEIGKALRRVDQLQTLFITSQKFGLPAWISEELAYRAKMQMDRASRHSLKNADLFLFYNGCGLDSARWFKRKGGINVVEAVNSHVLVQEQILAEEHKSLGLPWRPFHSREVKRRVAEVENADYVLLPSRFVARSFLARGVPGDRLLLVPYPIQNIPGAQVNGDLGKRDDTLFRVLFVGSISVRKGLIYLMEAFRRLRHPKKELWVVGPLANPSGIANISIPNGVKFFGPLKGEELQAAYMQSTVFCLPSIEEGMALVLSEALSYGLPVIASENTGVEELLTDGKGGTMVPIRNARAIGDCLERLAEDEGFLELQRQEALATAARLKDHFKTAAGLAETLMKTFRQHHSTAAPSH